MAVLHCLCVIPFIHADQSGFLDRLRVIADTDIGMLQNVIRKLLAVDHGSVRLHRFLRVKDEGQFLVFDLDLAGSLRRRDFILRNDNSHIVAVVADMPVQDPPVGGILMGRIHGIRMSRGREVDLRHFKAGEDPDKTGNLLRLGSVNAFDITVRDR